MTPWGAVRLAWGRWGVAVALMVAGLAVNPALVLTGEPGLLIPLSLVFTTAGAFLAGRRPANPLGWLLAGWGMVMAFGDLHHLLRRQGPGPRPRVAARPQLGRLGRGGGLAPGLRPARLPAAAAVPPRPAALAPLAALRRGHGGAGVRHHLRDKVDLDTLSTELLAVLDHTVQPASASLWLRPR